MFYTILKYYKDNCGLYNRVFCEMKIIYRLLNLYQIILLMYAVILLLLIKKIVLFVVFISIFICVTVVLVYVFNKKAKKIMLEKYDVNVDTFMWNNDKVLNKLFIYDKNIMNDYIKNKEISKNRVNKLVKEIENEIPKYKPKFPVIPSAVAALFVSLWNNQLSWIYKSSSILTLKDSLYIFLIGLFLIGLFWIILTVAKLFIETINDVIYSKDYEILKNFLRIINEIAIEIDER